MSNASAKRERPDTGAGKRASRLDKAIKAAKGAKAGKVKLARPTEIQLDLFHPRLGLTDEEATRETVRNWLIAGGESGEISPEALPESLAPIKGAERNRDFVEWYADTYPNKPVEPKEGQTDLFNGGAVVLPFPVRS